MQVIDPGHEYLLNSLDGVQENRLVFVKREGDKYPGNVGSHPGTTTQEVLRAVLDRLSYVNAQLPCQENRLAIQHIMKSIVLLEERAARLHGRSWSPQDFMDAVSGENACLRCGHVGCTGGCHDRRATHNRQPILEVVDWEDHDKERSIHPQ